MTKNTITHNDFKDALVKYQRQIGAGRMDRAAITIGEAVNALVDILLEAGIIEAGTSQAETKASAVQTTFQIEVGGLPSDKAKEFVDQQIGKVVEQHAAAVANVSVVQTVPMDPTSGPSPAVLSDIPSETQVSQPEPCEPCDVSIPNNENLIEDFKAPIMPPMENEDAEKVTEAKDSASLKTTKSKSST